MSLRKSSDSISFAKRNNLIFADDESDFCQSAKKMRIGKIREMSVLEIIEYVVKITENKPLCISGTPEKFLKVLSERLDITAMQALILSVFVNNCDDRNIFLRDLANHFDGNNISILRCSDDIAELAERGIIKRQAERRGLESYCVTQKAIESLCKNTMPELPKLDNLEAYEWFGAIEEIMDKVRFSSIEKEEFGAQLTELFKNNSHLHCVQAILSHNLEIDALKLFMALSIVAINNYDDRLCADDIEDYYKRPELRCLVEELESGDNILFSENMIEHANNHGQVDSTHWKLTDYSKEEIYSEFHFKKSKALNSSLIQPDDVKEKKLYFNDEISGEIERLRSLLSFDRMKKVMDRLEEKGMRRGFACLFYGAPGTGKTETVLQLAKASGRPIMQVNIASIRSKWVGETEQNMKLCFDNYRKLVKSSELSPILFFNEADALFTTRNENAKYGVDKMENTMQNIILQEMENLEGILIATTNLQDTLDPAFERRFLYKIEFVKPTPAERCHIWEEMLPQLTHADALFLAEHFDFSGGQIENIARKCQIDDILLENTCFDKESMMTYCKREFLHKDKRQCIGFTH